MTGYESLTVLPYPRIGGWQATDDGTPTTKAGRPVGQLRVVPLSEALSTHWDTDAHAVCWPRPSSCRRRAHALHQVDP